MKVKKILGMFMIMFSLSFVLQINMSQAALQANGDTPVTKARNTWMTEVRGMEGVGGVLGLEETINADLTSSSGSNKLDIHMQKNTEYGAMALLSASAYGKPEKIGNGETTTGNETGVVIPYNKEWVAAQYTDKLGQTSYANRYINYYTYSGNSKSGDASISTNGWHATTSYHFYGQYLGYLADGNKQYGQGGALVRNLGSGIFSFSNRYFSGQHSTHQRDLYEGVISNAYTTRAVIINGEGI